MLLSDIKEVIKAEVLTGESDEQLKAWLLYTSRCV